MGRYLIAAFTARLADSMWLAPVLLVLERTGSGARAGLVLAAATLPTVVTAPLLGAWLDAFGRRRLALTVHLLAVAAALSALTLGAPAVACAALAGLLQPLVTGGFSSLVPALAGGPRAAGFDALTYNVASILGPATAGAIAAGAGARVAVCAQAGIALASVPFVLMLPSGAHAARPFATTLRSGVAHLVRHPALRRVTLVSSLGQVGWGSMNVLAPALAVALGAHAADGGLLLAAIALGGVVGALLVPRVSPPALVVGGTVVHGLALASLALAPSLFVALVAAATAGIPQGLAAAAMFRARAQWSPPELRAQVFTSAAGLRTGLFALGAAAAGPVLALGPRWAVAAAGVAVIAAGASGSPRSVGTSAG